MVLGAGLLAASFQLTVSQAFLLSQRDSSPKIMPLWGIRATSNGASVGTEAPLHDHLNSTASIGHLRTFVENIPVHFIPLPPPAAMTAPQVGAT
jgi:hypothetical protein